MQIFSDLAPSGKDGRIATGSASVPGRRHGLGASDFSRIVAETPAAPDHSAEAPVPADDVGADSTAAEVGAAEDAYSPEISAVPRKPGGDSDLDGESPNAMGDAAVTFATENRSPAAAMAPELPSVDGIAVGAGSAPALSSDPDHAPRAGETGGETPAPGSKAKTGSGVPPDAAARASGPPVSRADDWSRQPVAGHSGQAGGAADRSAENTRPASPARADLGPGMTATLLPTADSGRPEHPGRVAGAGRASAAESGAETRPERVPGNAAIASNATMISEPLATALRGARGRVDESSGLPAAAPGGSGASRDPAAPGPVGAPGPVAVRELPAGPDNSVERQITPPSDASVPSFDRAQAVAAPPRRGAFASHAYGPLSPRNARAATAEAMSIRDIAVSGAAEPLVIGAEAAPGQTLRMDSIFAAGGATFVDSGPARPEMGRLAVAQMVELAARNPNRPVEIALNPEELGRVRMALSTHDAGVTVQIAAERPETMDLLRRHIDQLAADFRRLGYDQIGFEFSGGSAGGSRGGSGPHETAVARAAAEMPDVMPADGSNRPGPSTTTALDLRL